ncbi:MAG: hypothetical protein QNK24_01885, partial [Desulfuromusa sp.]|nr:hypothetical protein [Desulfuromusa sp.]
IPPTGHQTAHLRTVRYATLASPIPAPERFSMGKIDARKIGNFGGYCFEGFRPTESTSMSLLKERGFSEERSAE